MYIYIYCMNRCRVTTRQVRYCPLLFLLTWDAFLFRLVRAREGA